MSEKTKGYLVMAVVVILAMIVKDILDRMFLSSTLDNLLPASYEQAI